MAKKAKKLHTRKGVELRIVSPNAAGIDIADTEMQVCVPSERDGDNNRRFGSFTRDLTEISEWLMLLHTYGLLRASYQPENEARQVRNLARHRENLLRSSGKEVQHMQKAMEQMNIKLTNVLSDIVGKSGEAIVEAILSGNHNPESLAQLADGRCKRSKEDIALSLEGTWEADHLFELKQVYELYKYLQTQVTECDHKIEEMLKSYAVVVDTEMSGYVESKKTVCRKNAVAFDVEKYGYAIWGINPMTIPGMSVGSVLQLIGELGHNFVLKFDTPEKFCKWCNIVPNNKISGGKLLSSRVPKRKNPVGQIFRLCANALKDAKNPMGYYFRRIKSRGGHMQAIVATAHKMARIFYVMVRNKCAYDETKVGLDEKEFLTMKIQRTQRALDRLNAKLSAAVC